MYPAVRRPSARSRSRCSIGRRTRAWRPVMKTRPSSFVYLSSRLTSASIAGPGNDRLRRVLWRFARQRIDDLEDRREVPVSEAGRLRLVEAGLQELRRRELDAASTREPHGEREILLGVSHREGALGIAAR